MARRETYLTPEGKQQLEEELEQLKSVRRQEVADRIHTAQESGGAIDNAEYEEAKNEHSFVEGRIQDLNNLLSGAIIAPAHDTSADVVEFGSSVTVEAPDGKTRVYKVVGSAEASPLEGKISNESPVGRALLGGKVGDEVEVETPSGMTKLKITKIR